MEGIDHPNWKEVEGIDHPVWKIGSSSKDIVEGVDHPGWKQVMYDSQMVADKNYGKIDSISLGRQAQVKSNYTCSRPSRGMSHKTLCIIFQLLDSPVYMYSSSG